MEELEMTIPPDQPLLRESGKLEGHSCWTTFLMLANYLRSDLQKRQRSFRIGVFSIFIVVAFLSMLLSIVMLGSIVFLKVAENEAGEQDMIITPVSATNDTRTLETDEIDVDNLENSLRLLNFEEIRDAASYVDEIEGVSPRWILIADLSNPLIEDELFTKCYIILADTKLERDIGFGRSFSKKVLGSGQAFVSKSALQVLGIDYNEGEKVTMTIDFYDSLVTADVIDPEENDRRAAIEEFLDSWGILDDIGDVEITDEDIRENYDFDFEFDGNFSITITNEELRDFIIDAFVEASEISIDFEVVEAIDKPYGKWPAVLGNVIMVDAQSTLDLVIEQARESLQSTSGVFSFAIDEEFVDNVVNQLEEIDIYQYTLFANVILKDRLDIYTGTTDHMKARLVDVSNQLYERLGVAHPSTPTAPLALQMEGVQIVKTFLDMLFMSVLTFLVILSILLIYSLMLSDVEEKTYEFGMLRALGLRHRTLIGYLLMQATTFSIPGLIMGLIVAYILNSIGAFIISEYADIGVNMDLHPLAVVTGIILGTIMPLVSMYMPIKRALTHTLRDSLDLYHRTVSDLKVTILKLEKLGLSPPQMISAIMMVVVGFITYYLVPLAFQLNKIEMFLYLLNIILILMIFGLTFMAHLLQNLLESGLARIIVWCSYVDRKLIKVVLKNLQGHERRNWKTSLMFAVALSFVILSGVGFTLQGTVIKKVLMMTLGSDLFIQCPYDDIGGLKEAEIRNWIDNIYLPDNPGNIESYTFMSNPLNEIEGIDDVVFSVASGFPQQGTQLVAVEENYLESVYQQFYIPSEEDPDVDFPELDNGEIDLIHGLYTDEDLISFDGNLDYYNILSNGNSTSINYRGNTSNILPIKMVIAEGLRHFMSMTTDTPIKLEVEVDDKDDNSIFRGRVRGMAVKIPGFFFSGYRQVAFFSTTLISFPQMRDILDYAFEGRWPTKLTDNLEEGTSYNIPKHWLLIKVDDDLSQTDRDIIANGVRTYFRDDKTILLDVVELAEVAELTIALMEIFFLIVGIIALCLAFFLLWTSFSSNVRENSWEFGVLRAIGLTGNECVRIYIYEAVSLCLAAAILGSTVGIIVAVTMTLQFNLFTELPFELEFPVIMYTVLLTVCMGTAVLGSYIPLKEVKRHPISHILRGLND